MSVNIWGTPVSPDSGLPAVPVHTKSTESQLRKQARDASDLADRLQAMLDEATTAFETSFTETDRRDATRKRIASLAKTRTL